MSTLPLLRLRFARLLVSAALPAALLATACKQKPDAPPAPPPAPPLAVSTEPATTIDAPRTLRLTGALRGERETDLA
ncbi:MAG TPA: hypothetical protein VGQ57_20170, partial [Polyangiaceae bacterium]|nr:hypothetical protein [Polyangiaceae bacterium]